MTIVNVACICGNVDAVPLTAHLTYITVCCKEYYIIRGAMHFLKKVCVFLAF